MSIVGSGKNLRIEYQMPEDIKCFITDDFLREFRNQLFRLHEHYSLDLFAEYGIPANTSTNGWETAFGKACLMTHNEELYDYWRSLPWYDSDIFDGELADMLVDRHFILGDLSKIIEEKLGVKEDDLRYCNDCGKLYAKEMVVEITDENEESLLSRYRCLYCQDMKDTKNADVKISDYYRKTAEELFEYKKQHPVNPKEN